MVLQKLAETVATKSVLPVATAICSQMTTLKKFALIQPYYSQHHLEAL
jgi:hypothetical protein